MKLCNFASVRSGLVLSRKQAKESTPYRYALLNLRAIRPEGDIDINQLDVYDAVEALKPEYLTRRGDIIVRLTAPYTAILIDESTSGLVISSNFVVIRTEHQQLLPEYLYWFLNTQQVKQQFYENTTSNMLGAIKAKFLSEFELALLPVEEQRKIAQLHLLAKRESQLLRQLADEKDKYYTGLLDKAYQRVKRGK